MIGKESDRTIDEASITSIDGKGKDKDLMEDIVLFHLNYLVGRCVG